MEYQLIDKTYFTDIYYLPGLTGKSNINDLNVQQLNSKILKYQRKYLIDLLGKKLADLFIIEFESYKSVGTPMILRFSNLLAKIVDTNNLESGIIGYVFFNIKRNEKSTSTQGGEVVAAVENGTLNNDNSKIWAAWNDSLKFTLEVIEYLEENNSDYPELEINYAVWQSGNIFSI